MAEVGFENIKGRLGMGCMRLPARDGGVDLEQIGEMVDLFMERGFNYFDTAHGYLNGQSETALRRCLTERYPRESYVLADKLSTAFFQREEDIRPLFESQLAACGVDFFDFYLMHAQRGDVYEKFVACRAYETVQALKAEGKIRHIGISFHDTAQALERILTQQPAVEVVQLQFNYADYADPAIQSRACYEVCRRFGKKVIVMEPVKGGILVDLPEQGRAALECLGVSPAELAIRFAAGFENVMVVLSGMGSRAMVEENTGFMAAFRPLDSRETEALERVRESFRTLDIIPCTGCRYCVDGCPASIPIPDLFACLNAKRRYGGGSAGYYYDNVYTLRGGKASACIACGQCEQACPQKLPVRALLQDVARTFET